MTADLVEFLRARLDEDERKARAATDGPWRHDPGKHWRKPGTSWVEEAVFAGPAGAEATCVAGTGESDDSQSMADAVHIARHDPARVLAEVDAKRRIIEAHDYREPMEDSPTLGPAPAAEIAYCPICQVSECLTLRLLALPSAAHPDYRPEWAPGA